jgi:hypothetical protein
MENWDRIFGIRRTRRIFVAATRQNVGKTTMSLGLIASLSKQFGRIGFIKPVGQRYLLQSGYKIDEDSVLMNKIFKFKFSLQDMSPLAVEKGYTEKYLDGEIGNDTPLKIKESFSRVAENKEFVIIEGTGHAGVGSVFDMSNAAVAKMLDSRVVLVSPGGIGNPIDEIMLNKAVFDRKGVKVTGVVVNKVLPGKYDKVNTYVRRGLKRFGINVLGVIPYVDVLDIPTMRDFRDELGMHVLCGEEYLGRQMRRVLVGAMEAREASRFIEDDSLIITPGNRSDFINLVIKIHSGKYKLQKRVGGLILSGGLFPSKRIMWALKRSRIPTLLSRLHTYEVASNVHDLRVKIKSRDKNKVKLAIDMVEKYIDLDRIIRAAS